MTEPKPVDEFVRQSGHLDVGGGHRIYYEDWGNPDGAPIMHLHGGPGSGFNDKHKLLYNPEVNRVIFHDQRGCGQSRPFASIKDNTTQHLIADIEKLRRHLGIDKMHMAGGSWGSTLTLLYAIAHPESLLKIMMWGIFLNRQSETDFLYQGGGRETFPEAWQRFISYVPAKDRSSSMGVIKFYAGKIQAKDNEVAQKYAAEWSLWESSTVSLSYDRLAIEREVLGGDQKQQDFNLAIARLESHYFLNNCFIEDNYILKNLEKIKHIPAYVIQGRFDMCTPPSSAIHLAKAYGPKLNLQIVRAGHLRTEPESLAALRAVAATALI
jgi:proline iminopeptidase